MSAHYAYRVYDSESRLGTLRRARRVAEAFRQRFGADPVIDWGLAERIEHSASAEVA